MQAAAKVSANRTPFPLAAVAMVVHDRGNASLHPAAPAQCGFVHVFDVGDIGEHWNVRFNPGCVVVLGIFIPEVVLVLVPRVEPRVPTTILLSTTSPTLWNEAALRRPANGTPSIHASSCCCSDIVFDNLRLSTFFTDPLPALAIVRCCQRQQRDCKTTCKKWPAVELFWGILVQG